MAIQYRLPAFALPSQPNVHAAENIGKQLSPAERERIRRRKYKNENQNLARSACYILRGLARLTARQWEAILGLKYNKVSADKFAKENHYQIHWRWPQHIIDLQGNKVCFEVRGSRNREGSIGSSPGYTGDAVQTPPAVILSFEGMMGGNALASRHTLFSDAPREIRGYSTEPFLAPNSNGAVAYSDFLAPISSGTVTSPQIPAHILNGMVAYHAAEPATQPPFSVDSFLNMVDEMPVDNADPDPEALQQFLGARGIAPPSEQTSPGALDLRSPQQAALERPALPEEQLFSPVAEAEIPSSQDETLDPFTLWQRNAVDYALSKGIDPSFLLEDMRA